MFVCSPNESGAPRGLGRLKDTSVWEKRKVKGKVAIQKMVVDLMEVYLNRLRLKRPPYPKNPAMAEFIAQFPYDPTPDQKQVSFRLSDHINRLFLIWFSNVVKFFIFVIGVY